MTDHPTPHGAGECRHWLECPDCRAFIGDLLLAAQHAEADGEARGYQRAREQIPELRERDRKQAKARKRRTQEAKRAAWESARPPFYPPPPPAGLPGSDLTLPAWQAMVERYQRDLAAWRAAEPRPGPKPTGIRDAHITELRAAWFTLRKSTKRPPHKQTLIHLHPEVSASDEAIETIYNTSRNRLQDAGTNWSTLSAEWETEYSKGATE